MSRFERFCDSVCYRVVPLMLLGLMFVIVEIIKIFTGKALGAADMIALVGGLVESYGVLILWFALTVIQKHRGNKHLQNGGDAT